MDASSLLNSSTSRRALFALPLLPLLRHDDSPGSRRAPIARVVPERPLVPPLTLGLARVVLRSGATAWAETPGGARMLVVESGGLEVGVASRGDSAITSSDLAAAAFPPLDRSGLYLPAGTAMPFGSLGIVSLRNPGARAAVVLDAAVYSEEPRPLARAFTTSEGVSFQLLASASALTAPEGRAVVTLERILLSGHSFLLPESENSLSIMYLEVGTVDLRPTAGEVFAARAAASAPYAMPGALQALPAGGWRNVTAGGVIFRTVGATMELGNAGSRFVELLALTVRGTEGSNVNQREPR